jgi:hypothetical protein
MKVFNPRVFIGTQPPRRRWESVMPPRPPSARKPRSEPTLATGVGAPMSAEQAAALRQLAFDAYEPDAFAPILTQAEAACRIAMLQAKLKLLDGPPHTL